MADDPSANPPLINTAIEDALAHAATEGQRVTIMSAWLLIGAEYLARQIGRRQVSQVLDGLADYVRTAEPSRPWPS